MTDLTREQVMEWQRAAERYGPAPIFVRIIALCRALLAAWGRISDLEESANGMGVHCGILGEKLALAREEAMAARGLLDVENDEVWETSKSSEEWNMAAEAYIAARAANEAAERGGDDANDLG